jgi:hypothetical protein
MGIGDWADKILIGAVGAIFIWFGMKVNTLTDKVQALCETMSALTVEMSNNKSETDRLRADFAAHVREDRINTREERQRVPRFGWRSK